MKDHTSSLLKEVFTTPLKLSGKCLFQIVGTLFAFVLAACHGSPVKTPPPKPVGTFQVPRTRGPITIDGKCNEASWQFAFRSPPFEDGKGQFVPHGELRAMADDTNLYIEIYLADIDIRSHGDVVKLDVGPIHIELTPKGATAPAGVRTAIDTDDTIDEPKDFDEEWVNEVAIPWSLLGSHDVPVRAFRVDAGHNEPLHGMAWPLNAPALLRFHPDAN